MSTFLQICQKVARKSGTISGGQPVTAVSQTGRLLKVVNFVDDAWDEIQTSEDYWNWMRRDFTKTIDNPTQAYTPAALAITDFSRWDKSKVLSMYRTSYGTANEGPLRFIEWRDFRNEHLIGEINTKAPSYWSVRPQDNALVFNTIPDAEFTIRGEYIKDNQELVADTDIPECPAKYHKAIMWLALQMLNEHDEAYDASTIAGVRFNEALNKLCIDQLEPCVVAGGPIA